MTTRRCIRTALTPGAAPSAPVATAIELPVAVVFVPVPVGWWTAEAGRLVSSRETSTADAAGPRPRHRVVPRQHAHQATFTRKHREIVDWHLDTTAIEVHMRQHEEDDR